MIRFLLRPASLIAYILILLFCLIYIWQKGVAESKAVLVNIQTWLMGGEYQGYAVLSVAFAMNTWGLAVKSTRQKVRRACRERIKKLLVGLRTGRYLEVIDLEEGKANLGFWASVWFRLLYRVIKRYDRMSSSLLEISSEFTELFMCLSAITAVACMIQGVNGRFAAFLLLPYPIFWCYSKLALVWVKIALETPMFFLKIAWAGKNEEFSHSAYCSALMDMQGHIDNTTLLRK